MKDRRIQPLRTGKWMVLESQDKTAWVVCGHNCAAKVPKVICADKAQAASVALKNPDLWR